MRIFRIYFAVLVSIASLSGCSSGNSQQITGRVYKENKYLLSPDEFEQQVLNISAAQIVDVREPEELKYGYITGAANIDYHASDFEAKIDSELDKSRPVFVYCMSGGRSEKAAKIIRKLGFSEVYDLKGGIDAWEKAGKKMAK